MNCFDCAFTAGKCIYDANANICVLPSISIDSRDRRWWEWFQYCEDELDLCQSSADTIEKITGSDLSDALTNGNEVSFAIAQNADSESIPRNYFCAWDVDINSKAEYQLSIKRSFYPIKELLELMIIGGSK